jgi:large-conductance mechanosensitive channel
MFMVKFIGLVLARKKAEQVEAPAAPAESQEQKLLKEIRDLLATQKR